MDDDVIAPDEAKVFLSYSRKDRERASGIAGALRARHFGVFKDTDDILPTEEWKARLEELIEEADTIVFLLSPHSAASEVCAWEVEYATSLNKRIAPIVIEDVEGDAIPPLLARLNFIFCTPRDPFENAVDTLASALSTDIDWIREHTRLAGLARRWENAGRPARLLLRGQDIADAEGWRDERPKEAPEIALSQAALIAESRRAAGRRQRNWIMGSLAAAAGAAALAVFAYFQSVEADRQRAEAEAQRGVAQENAAEAERQREAAEKSEERARETRDDAWLTQSAILTDWAEEATEAGDGMTATLLLLAALPDSKADRVDADRPLFEKAAQALYARHFYGQEAAVLEAKTPHGEDRQATEAVAYSPDGALIMTLTRAEGGPGALRLWRGEDGAPLRDIPIDAGRVDAVAFHPDGARIAALTATSDIVWIDVANGAETARFTGCPVSPSSGGWGRELAFSADGGFLASGGSAVCVWDIAEGAVTASVDSGNASVRATGLGFIRDGAFLHLSDGRHSLLFDTASGRILTIRPGVGTVESRVNRQGTRMIVTDTGSPLVPPGQTTPEDHVWPSTRLWDLENPGEIAVLSAREALRDAGFSDDGERIAASQDDRIRVWDALTGEEISTRSELAVDSQYFAQNDQLLRAANYARGGRYVVSADFEDVRKVWDQNGREFSRFKQPRISRNWYASLTYSPAFEAVVEHAVDAQATLWKIGASRSLRPLEAHMDELAGGVDANTLAVIRAYFRRRSESKLQGLDWPNGEEPSPASAVSDEGVTAEWLRGEEEAVRLLDAAGGEVAMLGGHDGPVLSAAFRPGSAQIAIATREAVRIWDVTAGQETARIEGDLSGLPHRHRTVFFSADGARLIILSEDYVDVFDAEILEKRLSLMSEDAVLNEQRPGDFYGVSENAFFDALKAKHDPRAVAATKDDLSPRFWLVMSDLQAVIDYEKAHATRCLNPRQMTRYHLGSAPPVWCVTGPGREDEANPKNWRPLRPYHTVEWRDWLLARNAAAAE